MRTIVPNEKIHFSGRIFLLANEYSRSMASDFASALVGQASCTIVGRETGSSYYQMNAEKFADMLLFTTNLKAAHPHGNAYSAIPPTHESPTATA